MIIIIVILTIVVFVVVDFLLRIVMQNLRKSKIKKEREKALKVGLRLDFTLEAKTLKRVEVENPKARILAVDDEEIILDSFRKILVLEGFSIDTVERGEEALGLIQKHDYDFVFTDIKMPGMDGVEVTKSVKHLRPDIDVIVVTGYATIETAVETMKFGATDYIQKPFTEDELIEYVNKFLIKRKDNIEKQMRPTLRLVTATSLESSSKHEFNVPAGVFVSRGHTWVKIELNGTVRIGVDDFMRKIIGNIDKVILPETGKKIIKGDYLFSIKSAKRSLDFISPISGTVTLINYEHIEHPEWLEKKPFELCWMCCIEPTNLSEELKNLYIGIDSVKWYQNEIEKFNKIIDQTKEDNIKNENDSENINEINQKIWEEFIESYSQN